jgi:NADH-quinone oxidoreductase subunit K
MIVPLSHFVAVSAGLFAIGLFGALTRKNAIGILMAIELILNSVNLNLMAFGRHWGQSGESQVVVLLVIGMAAAAAVVGLALVLAIYRSKQTIAADEIRDLKG